MRIFKNEFIRLWKTPGIIMTLVIACFVTFGVLNMKSRGMVFLVQAPDYKGAFKEVSDMGPEAALSMYSDKEYDETDFSREAFLNKTIRSELQEQASYEDYLTEITDSAKRLTSVSIFADENSFSYRNALKTAQAYEELKGKITIETGPSKGMELWSGNGVTGIIIILVILIMINEMILKDRESGQMNLLFTMDKGRGIHGFIKILVCACSSFIVSFVISLAAFFTCGYIFGTGDITRSVQSVVGLKGCTLTTSVLGYMLVYFIMLSLATTVMSTIIFLIASILKSSVFVYMGVAVVFGVEAVLYYLISDNSYLAFLKEFNFISFLNPNRYLSIYGNVSMFGYPVNRLTFVICSLGLLTLAVVPLAVKAYSRQTTVVVKRNLFQGILANEEGLVHRLISKIRPKSISVLGHETYKLLICGGTLWIIAFFAVFQFMNFEPEREYFENDNSIYYKNYAIKFQGEITDATMRAIEEERKRYAEIETELQNILLESPPELAGEISKQYQDKLKPHIGLEILSSRIQTLRENGGYIVYDTGYRFLTFDPLAKRKELTLAITAGIMLVLALTYLFAGDDRLYMDRVTSVTLYGRRSLYIKKILLGSFVALIIYCLNYLPYFFSILNVYGTAGLSYPAQSVINLEGTIFEKLGFSIGGCIAFYMVLKYLIMIAEFFLLSCISRKLRSLSRTIVTGLVIFVGPFLIAYVLI